MKPTPRLWLFAVGAALLLLPVLLPALASAWLLLQPSADASHYVVVHFGPLWPLAALGLACVLYAAFAGRQP